MGLTFEWDENKAKQNLKKHSVSFKSPARFSATHCRVQLPTLCIRKTKIGL